MILIKAQLELLSGARSWSLYEFCIRNSASQNFEIGFQFHGNLSDNFELRIPPPRLIRVNAATGGLNESCQIVLRYPGALTRGADLLTEFSFPGAFLHVQYL